MARLFDYGEWANHRYLDAVAPLDAEAFGRDLKGSHGGIRGTLVHTYGAEWVWHQRFHRRLAAGAARQGPDPGAGDAARAVDGPRGRAPGVARRRFRAGRGRARDRLPDLQGRRLLGAPARARAARREPRQLPPRPARGVPAPARGEAADDRSRRLRPRARYRGASDAHRLAAAERDRDRLRAGPGGPSWSA